MMCIVAIGVCLVIVPILLKLLFTILALSHVLL